MKLEQFKVQNFRSVVDSNVIKVSDVTALIGPNEAGKSSILQALASISMDANYQLFDLTELNGILKKFIDRDLASKDIEIIWANFALSTADKEKLNSLIPPPEGTDQTHFEVSKYFDEFYKVVVNGNEYRIPSRTVTNRTLTVIKTQLQQLEEKGKGHLTRGPNNQFAPQFNTAMQKVSSLKTNLTSFEESQGLIQDLVDTIKLGLDEPFKKDITSSLQAIDSSIKEGYPVTPIERGLHEFLLDHMPRTVYFKTYERLEDDVSIKELKEKPELHSTFTRFLTLAEIKLDALERITDEKIRQVYLQTGCGKASRLLRDAWKQEVLDVELRYSSERLMVFTKNSKAIETLLPPSAGSEGFQWYLGFYINFGAATNAEYRNAILLLDDPGVFLHPKGHKDLLALFDGYLQYNVTTIYTTHLPFLIPRDHLDRLRLVIKESETQSRVIEKFYATADKDILYPLRAALGITLSDSLFVGEKTIVAEGISDRILIYGMLDEMKKRKLKPIVDLEKLEILAGSGARGAKGYAILLQIENLPYVAVLDNDPEGRSSKLDFVKDGISEDRIVILSKSSRQSKIDFDIEDLFTADIYADAFCNVHGTKIKIEKSDILKKLNSDTKFCNAAKELLKESKVIYDIDKQAIAYEILKIISKKDKLDEVITDNFIALFDEINSKMGIYEI